MRLSFKRAVAIAAILVCFGCQQNTIVLSQEEKRSAIAAMYQKYAREFSQVPSISVDKLQKWQQQQKKFVLVDVRTPKERKVSIIPGAIAREEFEQNLERYQQEQATIVAYCTIGYRSGKYAAKLRKQGIKVVNLEGSLLAWSHINGKLVDSAGATQKVHVFGRQWQLTADNYQPVW